MSASGSISNAVVGRWRQLLALRLGYKVSALVLLLGGSLGASFVWARTLFLPGITSNAHHLMEASCQSCHPGFSSVPNDGCNECHARASSTDTHPAALFDDPRWAATLATLDASRCATCHHEHRGPRRTVSAEPGFCFGCHDDVVDKRPSHAGLPRDSCARGGCHNFHDNSVLNAAFIGKHLDEPDLLATTRSLERPVGGTPEPAVVPDGLDDMRDSEHERAWAASGHARNGVGCDDCHVNESKALVRRPDDKVCAHCHELPARTFLEGEHGLRRRVSLPGLTAADARLPMAKDAESRGALGCGSCHEAHAVDTKHAATQACLGCHDDDHSRALEGSEHAEAGVTCATCHLPRYEATVDGKRRVTVQHDNSLTLAPRDRMLAMVCSDCHGFGFALSSLFDDDLAHRNFRGHPKEEHPTLGMLRHSNPSNAPAPGRTP